MENHKMLKEICDKIGYELPSYLGILFYKNKIIKFLGEDMIFKKKHNCFSSQGWISYGSKLYRKVDVREIIFTQEFMDKYVNYCLDKNIADIGFADNLLYNLSNPVQYLHNLLGLGKQ